MSLVWTTVTDRHAKLFKPIPGRKRRKSLLDVHKDHFNNSEDSS